MTHDDRAPVVVAGGTGDLGKRILRALLQRRAEVRAIVRPGTPAATRADLHALGATIAEADYANATALRTACAGASCVVSALNGLEPVMIGMQSRLLGAAIAAGVPRFVPSDYSLDYTKTRPGDNRNLDVRRTFMSFIDGMPIRATSILNGAFGELLTGQAPIVLHKLHKILYWGSADQLFDFTTKDDVADYVAAVALDAESPRFLRIAGTSVSPRDLATLMTEITGETYGLLRPGGVGTLGTLIALTRTITSRPGDDDVFPPWQGMQYMRDMSSGRGKLEPLDNDRYGVKRWTSAREILTPAS